MQFDHLVKSNRCYRRYDHSYPITRDRLEYLVDLARFASSSQNLQPLKYLLINDPNQTDTLYTHLFWAAGLPEWKGPAPHERPSAYILVLGDTMISDVFGIEVGMAVQNILLGATEMGLGGCVIAGIDKTAVREDFNIPEHLEILYAVPLGKPAEEIVIVPMDAGPNYYRDPKNRHILPKRDLESLILKNR